jgi:hypothetical protein
MNEWFVSQLMCQLNLLECHNREELQYFVRRNLFLVILFDFVFNLI